MGSFLNSQYNVKSMKKKDVQQQLLQRLLISMIMDKRYVIWWTEQLATDDNPWATIQLNYEEQNGT